MMRAILLSVPVFFLTAALVGCETLQQVAAPAATTTAGRTAAPAGAPPELSGVWAVSMQYKDGSCPGVTSGSRAATWTVNSAEAGAYDVAPVGPDEPPALRGEIVGSEIVLHGGEQFGGAGIVWRIHGSGDSLSGDAIETQKGKRTVPTEATRWSPAGTRDVERWCAVIWDVSLTRSTASP